MLGIKKSLPPILEILKNAGINNYTTTEFIQGHTTRWGLAWSFCDFSLEKVPGKKSKYLLPKSKKEEKPVMFVIPFGSSLKFDETVNHLKIMFKNLKVI